MNRKGLAPVLMVLIIAVALAIGWTFYYAKKSSTPKPVACTQEAKQCSDGSYVSRVGPNCEFAACPTVTFVDTSTWKTYRNDKYGFEVKYPAELQYNDVASENGVVDNYPKVVEIIDFKDKYDTVFLTIIIPDPKIRDIVTADGNWRPPYCGQVESSTVQSRHKTILANQKTLELLVSKQSGQALRYYCVNFSQNPIEIITFNDTHKSQVDQILSTFKFISPQ